MTDTIKTDDVASAMQEASRKLFVTDGMTESGWRIYTELRRSIPELTLVKYLRDLNAKRLDAGVLELMHKNKNVTTQEMRPE